MPSRYMYQIEVRHDGLNKYRLIRGTDKYIVEQKANAQLNSWNEMWEKKLEAESRRQEKEQIAAERQKGKELAEEKTRDAQDTLDAIERTLHYALSVDDKINWEELKDHSAFPEQRPQEPKLKTVPSEPDKNDSKYVPKLDIFDKLSAKKRDKKVQEAENRFQSDHESWTKTKKTIEDLNAENMQKHEHEIKAWDEKKQKFHENQSILNKHVEDLKNLFREKDPREF